jgi:hypothetical protein
VILDWDIDQIKGAVLESWLPSVFSRLEGHARLCGARMGVVKVTAVRRLVGHTPSVK